MIWKKFDSLSNSRVILYNNRVLEKILILSDIRTDKRSSFVSPNKYLLVRIIFAIFININHFYILIESRQWTVH
jgi:hypothetical protein